MGNCHVQTDHSTIDRSCRIFRNPLACSLSPRRPCLVQKTTLILDHPPRTIAVGGNTSPKMTGARESALLVDRGFSGIFILPPIVQSVPIPFDLLLACHVNFSFLSLRCVADPFLSLFHRRQSQSASTRITSFCLPFTLDIRLRCLQSAQGSLFERKSRRTQAILQSLHHTRYPLYL